ncbi:MAG: gas vesicle protein GvpG [Alphaproteobacteria bacterium]|nr:gas vesicle protein GvpG [Alphaproteobacteria bacterium]MDE2630267.1 gas vesicle protein GvpG [Alphaproteobacteria bacterium]
MGILGSILTSPVLGPINGVLWLARTIEEQANAERWDESKIVGGLAELELDLDLGKIGVEEFETREAALLQQLKEIQEAKNE